MMYLKGTVEGKLTNVAWRWHGIICEPNRNFVEYIGFYHFRMHMSIGTDSNFRYLVKKAMEDKHGISPNP